MRLREISGAMMLGLAAFSQPATAAETGLSSYQGAWLEPGLSCEDIYAGTGKSPSFKKPVDIFAPAFIISGKTLRTPMASCRVRSVKSTDDRQVITLNCANSVATNDVTVQMAAAPDGSLKRFFDDQDKIGRPYKRCAR